MPLLCPTAEELAALLKDDLSQNERTRIEAHLDECGACRAKLNALAGGSETRLRDASANEDPEVDLLLARLKTEEPGERIGNYKLLQEIGEGGFGTVWMAEQEKPVRRRVALKIIKLGMDTKEVIARFEQERQALAMMDHPNIAKVFDAGATESGRPFFVMELVRGVRITEYCDQHKLGMRERLELFTTVCNAVQHAHQKGIIHRDLKPSNILVTLEEGSPVPKVIDFGVAKATQARLTELTLFCRGVRLAFASRATTVAGVATSDGNGKGISRCPHRRLRGSESRDYGSGVGRRIAR